MVGDYTGYFYCDGTKYTASMTLKGSGGVLVSGSLDFEDETGAVTGSAEIGGASTTAALLISVTNWIVDPSISARLSFSGALDPGTGILDGEVVSCNAQNDFQFVKDNQGTQPQK